MALAQSCVVREELNVSHQRSKDAKQFYIFGNKIKHSLSPTIHNAAFADLGLPHHYSAFETPQIDEQVSALITRSDFGGASVTAPHKLQIQPYLDTFSDAAAKVGAVNTVIVRESPAGRKLHGDNTDWLGLLALLKKGNAHLTGNAIVLGAGGAARAAVYALQTFGWKEIKLVNRSRSTADRLAADFSELKFEHFVTMMDAPAATVIIGCFPAENTTEEDIPDSIFAQGTGLVIEMSYLPPISALMKVASKKQWQIYGGVDVLKEQAYAQFELWTGKPAPIRAIEKALSKSAQSKT